MNFPDDSTLIARGKYSTLNKARREQLERVQSIGKLLMANANPLLRDCEEKPPSNPSPLTDLEKYIKNARDAREKLIVICAEMAELEPIAWPK